MPRRAILVLALGGCAADDCPTDGGALVRVGTLTGLPSELSGIAASDAVPGLLWTHDDGSSRDVFAIDAATATTQGTLHLAGADTVDWEDLATGPCAEGHCIYVADTGDNELTRATVAIFEVTEPARSPVGTIDVAYRRYELRFTDGPHDIEALFVDPRDGTSYGVTKVSGPPVVYSLPRIVGQIATAGRVAAIDLADTGVSAASLIVDRCALRLALRTHDHLYELTADPAASIGELLAATPHKLKVADEPQGEGVTYGADGSTYFTVSEGATPPLWRFDRE